MRQQTKNSSVADLLRNYHAQLGKNVMTAIAYKQHLMLQFTLSCDFFTKLFLRINCVCFVFCRFYITELTKCLFLNIVLYEHSVILYSILL